MFLVSKMWAVVDGDLVARINWCSALTPTGPLPERDPARSGLFPADNTHTQRLFAPRSTTGQACENAGRWQRGAGNLKGLRRFSDAPADGEDRREAQADLTGR